MTMTTSNAINLRKFICPAPFSLGPNSDLYPCSARCLQQYPASFHSQTWNSIWAERKALCCRFLTTRIRELWGRMEEPMYQNHRSACLDSEWHRRRPCQSNKFDRKGDYRFRQP